MNWEIEPSQKHYLYAIRPRAFRWENDNLGAKKNSKAPLNVFQKPAGLILGSGVNVKFKGYVFRQLVYKLDCFGFRNFDINGRVEIEKPVKQWLKFSDNYALNKRPYACQFRMIF